MKCNITNNSDMNIDELSPLIDDLASHVQNVMKIKSMPAVTLQEDADNADVLLGKTAQYDPQNKVITVYVTNRHPKDIMRSISHEMIHHAQNERGEFDNVGTVGEGYAQADKHLRNMEKEAYLKGNMCFRDWEDGYKKQMMESIHRQNSFKRRNNTMKIHKWKNNELNRLLMEKFSFGENTLLNEAHCAGNKDDDEDKEETMDEAHCMGQGSRGDEPCPDCGKKNCPGKDGKEVNEEKKDDKGDDEPEMSSWEDVKKLGLYRKDRNGKIVPVTQAYARGQEMGKAIKKFFGLDEQVLEEKQFANSDELDADKDGVPKWADKNDKDASVSSKGSKKKKKEDEKEKQEESFRDSVRKLMEEIIGLQ